MTGRDRLPAAFRGEPVDRVPIRLREEVAPHLDLMHEWGFGQHLNRFLMVQAAAIEDRGLRFTADALDATDPVEPPPAGDLSYAEARTEADGRIALVDEALRG